MTGVRSYVTDGNVESVRKHSLKILYLRALYSFTLSSMEHIYNSLVFPIAISSLDTFTQDISFGLRVLLNCKRRRNHIASQSYAITRHTYTSANDPSS
jgi:hypothetical protein